jgi:hypothetical protein
VGNILLVDLRIEGGETQVSDIDVHSGESAADLWRRACAETAD